MKKIIALILCLLLCFSAVACTPTPDPTEPPVTEPTVPTLPPDAVTELVGKWKFNDTLTPANYTGSGTLFEYDVGFLTNGNNIYFQFAFTATEGENPVYTLIYHYDKVAYDSSAETPWTSDAFQVVDFGIGAITVDPDFYLWFINNATPIK